jgi:hypothetical protein
MIYNLNDSKINGNAKVLDEHFDNNVLHLTHHNLGGYTPERWLALQNQIKKIIKEKNIDLIVMDACGDPWNLDYDHNGYSISLNQMMSILNEYCQTIIITDDWHYQSHPVDNIRFFSEGLWHQSQKNLHNYYHFQDTVYDTTLLKTKPLMCLNNVLEWHRIYLLYLIHDKSWFNDIDFSFINALGDRLVPTETDFSRPSFTEEQIQTLKLIDLPIRLRGEINPAIGFNGGASSVDLPVYRDNAINLVTETSVCDYPGIALSEKTAKPIMAYQIPILISNVGAEQWLEDVGIDMFSDYIPWKQWDSIVDPKARLRSIAEFVDGIMQDPNKILEKHQNLHPRLVANKQRFHSQEFGDLLRAQIT